jgi:DNA-binding transcriptional LysR family regulator
LHYIIAHGEIIIDRIDRLRLFIGVADCLSFVEAARAMRISAAAASRAIAALEGDLRVPLFRRTTRAVALTQEGAVYLERARTALAELDAAAIDLRGENAEPQGSLIISAPVVFGRMHILPVVNALLSAHRRLDARLVLTDRVVRLVDEGIDIAVRIADLADSALHAVRLGDVRRVLVASPAYLARRGRPARLTDLHDHCLVAFDNFTANDEWRFGVSEKTAVKVAPRLRVNSVDATIDAVVSDLGITRLLNYQVADLLARGELVEVLAEHAPYPVPIHLVFQANRQRSPNVRAFIDQARATIPPALAR